jgi:ABC-2 type transport system permease protein
MTGPNAPVDVRRSAPTRARVLSRAAFETRMLLANGEQLLVSLILPALALIGLTLSSVPDLGDGDRAVLALAGTLALAVVSTAFTGQAIGTGFDRRSGVLRLLGTTPLGRDGLLAAKALAVLSVLAVQVLVLGGLGLALGARPEPGGLVPAALTLLLGSACFVALALLLAGTLRAEAVLAVANLVWVLLLGLGLLVPTTALPGILAGVAAALPSGALGDAMRLTLVEGGWPLAQWAVLAVWGAGAGVLASRTFRWSD